MRSVAPLDVDAQDAETLRGWLEPGAARPVLQQRARIVLSARDGLGPTQIAAALGCYPQTVITWRDRYRAQGLAGLTDAPRPGRPAAIDPGLVIARTREHPPPHLGATHWTSRLLAAELGISNTTVAKIWRAHDIHPRQPRRQGTGVRRCGEVAAAAGEVGAEVRRSRTGACTSATTASTTACAI